LFVTGLRIEGNCDDIILFGDIDSQLPCLLADWLSPIDFAGVVVCGNSRYEVLEVVASTDFLCWCDNDSAVLYRNVHLVPNSKTSIFQHILGKTQSLTITPFLNLCIHATTSFCIAQV